MFSLKKANYYRFILKQVYYIDMFNNILENIKHVYRRNITIKQLHNYYSLLIQLYFDRLLDFSFINSDFELSI